MQLFSNLFTTAACFLAVVGEVSAQASAPEDCSDQCASSLLQTALTVPKLEVSHDSGDNHKEKGTKATSSRSGTSSVTDSEPLVRGDRCAVCFIGELRGLNETIDSLRRNLLGPIASTGVTVDVFVAAARKGPFGIVDFGLASTEKLNVSNSGPEWLPRVAIRDFRWQPEPSVEVLQDMITSVVPKKALEHYKIPGAWMGPIFGQPGNDIRIYRHEAECVEMLQQREQAFNMRYKWVMRTRTDFLWLVPHPPLSLINTGMLWTFDTEAYGGVNTRHAVGGRDEMVAGTLSKMKMLQSGDPLVYKMHSDGKSAEIPQGDEFFSKITLESLSIQVGLIPTPAYLVETPSWSTSSWRNAAGLKTYDAEVKAATSNSAQWKLGSCWVQIAHDKLCLKHNCSDDSKP